MISSLTKRAVVVQPEWHLEGPFFKVPTARMRGFQRRGFPLEPASIGRGGSRRGRVDRNRGEREFPCFTQ